jgi:hypothetical protein
MKTCANLPLPFIMETDSPRCVLRSQAEVTVDDRQTATVCEVPHKADERVNDLNITNDHHRI